MEKNENIRSYNVGNSNYSKHKIQPWDIWLEYNLNPWDADIVKRILRTKEEPGMSKEDARIMDYEKIIHICKERIRQIKENKPKEYQNNNTSIYSIKFTPTKMGLNVEYIYGN